MANEQNTIKTTVELDVNNAQQEIVKLNAAASDSTRSLEERVEAKNKAVELQNKLSKDTVKKLEKELNLLLKSDASIKDIAKVTKKLNSEKLRATKLSENNAKQQSKLNEALKDSKNATKNLDDATGGLLGKMKAFVANPIGLVIIAVAGAFKILSEAIGRSEKATAIFNQIGAKLSGVFNGLLAILEPVVVFIGEKLLSAINDPKQAFIDLGNIIKNNVINRFKALTILGDSIVKLFKGDFDGALESAKDGFLQLTTGVEDFEDKVKGAITNVGKTLEESKEKFNEVAKATENLANAERQLIRNQIALEKEQLKSLKAAEEQRQIRDDISKSIPERIEANKKLGQILNEQAKRELAIAQQNLNIERQKQIAKGVTAESIEAVGAAEVKILEIQERITGQRSEQLVNEQALIKENADKLKEIADRNLDAQTKLDEIALERLKLKNEATLAEELKFLEKKKAQELSNKELTETEKKEIEERFKLEKEELEAAEEERKAEEKLVKDEALLELEELEIERLREKGELTLERELEFLEKKRQQDVSQAGLTAEQILLINKKAEIESDKIRKTQEIAEFKKNESILKSAISAAGEAFGISKELALTESVFGLGKSIGDAWSANAKLGFPQNIIATGAQIAGQVPPILKSIQSIKSAKLSKTTKGANVSGPSTAGISTSAGGSTSSSGVSSNLISDLSSNNSARLGIDTGLGSGASNDASNNILGNTSNNIVFSESKYNDFKSQVEFKEDKITI